tara:strand:+ start:134 stop:283 length:150 start_codon:yes stop_codon:yes gene_type:complete
MKIQISKQRKSFFVSIAKPNSKVLIFYPKRFKTSLDALNFADTVVKKYI